MNVVTVPSYALIPIAIVLTLLTLCLAALSINRSSVRRSLDLSPVSTRTDRSDCPQPGCTVVHPGRGRHRADPRPDGPVTIIVAAFATGFGLITNPKGQHYDHWRLRARNGAVVRGSTGKSGEPAAVAPSRQLSDCAYFDNLASGGAVWGF